ADLPNPVVPGADLCTAGGPAGPRPAGAPAERADAPAADRGHRPGGARAGRGLRPPPPPGRLGTGAVLALRLLTLVRLLWRGGGGRGRVLRRGGRGGAVGRPELAARGPDAPGQPVPRPAAAAGDTRARVRPRAGGRGVPGPGSCRPARLTGRTGGG